MYKAFRPCNPSVGAIRKSMNSISLLIDMNNPDSTTMMTERWRVLEKDKFLASGLHSSYRWSVRYDGKTSGCQTRFAQRLRTSR